MARQLVLIAAVTALLLCQQARAQTQTPAGGEIDDKVAEALYQRGVFLYGTGDTANAKKMFVESLERSPNGPISEDALSMLRKSNERLGVDPEDGRPAAPSEVLDPYGESGGDQVMDPYGESSGEAGVLDPYGAEDDPGPGSGAALQPPSDTDDTTRARNGLMLWSGLAGLTVGLALGGPLDDDDNVSDGAVLAGVLGAGAGVGSVYFLSERRPMTSSQYAAVASGGTWGAVTFGFMGDVVTGDDSSTNAIYRSVALGGAAGVGLGYLYGTHLEPTTGDVAVVNSLGAYGMLSSLMFGVAIDPPRSEAYSLNAALGTALGLGAGVYVTVADYVETSRERTLLVDLGAAAGLAAPWVLLYPLVADSGTNNDTQAVGFISALTTLGGGALAFYLTRDYDDADSGTEAAEPLPAALLQRESDGQWHLGTPTPRPIATLGEPGGLALGANLAAGLL